MELVASVPATVLAVFAHPDDPEVACAGTLARWAAAGAEVHLAIAARGEKGTVDVGTDPDELASRRAGEAERAGSVTGLRSVELLGYADGDIDNTGALRAELVARIRRVRPDVVMGPDPTAVFFGDGYVNHRDHRELGWALLDAVAPAAGSPLYFPGAGPPHQVRELYLSGTLEPNVGVDVGDTVEVKVRALRCHGSQLGQADWLDDFVRERTAEAGRDLGVAHAEVFRRVRLRA